jgi:hypothetical protein
LCTAPGLQGRPVPQTRKVPQITFLRQFNPLIYNDYGELIKDSPRRDRARISGLCARLPALGPQVYPQALWISGNSFSKQSAAPNC